jgi:hypothetical protein
VKRADEPAIRTKVPTNGVEAGALISIRNKLLKRMKRDEHETKLRSDVHARHVLADRSSAKSLRDEFYVQYLQHLA